MPKPPTPANDSSPCLFVTFTVHMRTESCDSLLATGVSEGPAESRIVVFEPVRPHPPNMVLRMVAEELHAIALKLSHRETSESVESLLAQAKAMFEAIDGLKS